MGSAHPARWNVTRTEAIQTRVETKLKAEAERILDDLGLDASDAIRVFHKQVVLRKGLPFDVAIPNDATRRAMRDVEKRRGLTRYSDTAELRRKLLAPR
jgi:DNA-damage-inducible protein J